MIHGFGSDLKYWKMLPTLRGQHLHHRHTMRNYPYSVLLLAILLDIYADEKSHVQLLKNIFSYISKQSISFQYTHFKQLN